MTIAEVLALAGHPLGRRGRTVCPIHRGDNPAAFKFTETGAVCFACGWHGGAYQLRVALGLLPPPRARPRIGGVDPVVFARRTVPPVSSRPRPSRRLAAAMEVRRVARLNVWTALHARAIRQLATAELVLAAEPDDEGFDVAAELAVAAFALRDQADTQLGCDCRRPASLDQVAAIR